MSEGLGHRAAIARRCDDLLHLKVDWDHQQAVPPSLSALDTAKMIAEDLAIIPDYEGGCKVRLSYQDREVALEIAPDGLLR
jgi:hypothetical protein